MHALTARLRNTSLSTIQKLPMQAHGLLYISHIFLFSTPLYLKLHQAKTLLKILSHCIEFVHVCTWWLAWNATSLSHYQWPSSPSWSCPLSVKRAFDMASNNFSNILKNPKPKFALIFSSTMGTLYSFLENYSTSLYILVKFN